MKRIFIGLFFCFLTESTVFANFEGYSQKVKILTNGIPKTLYKNNNGEIDGKRGHELEAFMDKTGLDYEIDIEVWAKVYRDSLELENTLIFNLDRTPERENQFFWIHNFNSKSYSLITHKGSSFATLTLDEIKESNYRSACAIGAANCRMLEELGFKESRLEKTSRKEADDFLLLLERKRVDFVLIDADNVKGGFDETKFVKIFETLKVDTYLAASKKINKELLDTLLLTSDLIKTPIVIAADLWCPYNCALGEVDKGVLVEVIEEAFNTIGLEIQYKTLPWNRALRSIRGGEIDIILGAGQSDFGMNIDLSLGLEDEIVFLVPKNSSITLENMEEIFNFRLGVIGEYEYDITPEWGRFIDNHPKKIGVNTIEGMPKLIDLLSKKRVEVVVGNIYVMKDAIKKAGREGQFKYLKKGYSIPIGFGFTESEKGRVLQKSLNKGIKNLQSSGKLKIIFEKYGFEYP